MYSQNLYSYSIAHTNWNIVETHTMMLLQQETPAYFFLPWNPSPWKNVTP